MTQRAQQKCGLHTPLQVLLHASVLLRMLTSLVSQVTSYESFAATYQWESWVVVGKVDLDHQVKVAFFIIRASWGVGPHHHLPLLLDIITNSSMTSPLFPGRTETSL